MDRRTEPGSHRNSIPSQEFENVKKRRIETLPPILLKKHCPQSESGFELSESKIIPTLTYPYTNYEKKGKISFREHRLERFTRADELPLGLALKLTRDVIKMERRIKEESMMKEIRKNRKEYETQKNKAVANRLTSVSRGISLHTSQGAFSYFPPFDNKHDKAATSKNRENVLATVNQDRLSVNKKMALDKMKAFGLRYKVHARENSCRNTDNKAYHLNER